MSRLIIHTDSFIEKHVNSVVFYGFY